MHYDDGAFYRPLFENNMLQLQVTKGCSHNRCKFCDMYHLPFSPSSHEDIVSDLDEAARWYSDVPRVFLTGGNALCLPQPDLLFVLREVRKRFPSASVGSFARVTDIARKSDDELVQLAAMGVSDISIGTESGYNPALSSMGKGFSSRDILVQCKRLDRAGLTYDLFYLVGMAGHGLGQASAQATAELYSQLHPQRIMVHTMTAFSGTELAHEVVQGKFELAGELEMVRELRTFVELLDCKGGTYLLGNHYGNAAPACGRIPEDRARLLQAYDQVLANADEAQLAAWRAQMTSI